MTNGVMQLQAFMDKIISNICCNFHWAISLIMCIRT